MKRLKKNLILIIAVVLYIITLFTSREVFARAIGFSRQFLIEMVQILPLVAILSALITIWIPREFITKYLGTKAGIKGKFLAVLMGGLSAGPIYAAFPVCLSLLKKGASLSNMVIILSSWAVIKFPMLFVESRFLGFPFALTRYLLTLPFILLLGWLMGKWVPKAEVLAVSTRETAMKIIEKLPGYNCKACGQDSCLAFSRLVANGEKKLEHCKLLNRT